MRYKVICPNCSFEFDVEKSIFMTMGMNMGSCNCPKCNLMLNLECEEETKTMKAEDYEIFAKRIKEQRAKEQQEIEND